MSIVLLCFIALQLHLLHRPHWKVSWLCSWTGRAIYWFRRNLTHTHTTYLQLFNIFLFIVFAGGGLFGIFGKYTNRFGKDPIVLLGLLVHFATFLLIFYNLPVLAVFQKIPPDQSHGEIFDPSKYVSLEDGGGRHSSSVQVVLSSLGCYNYRICTFSICS